MCQIYAHNEVTIRGKVVIKSIDKWKTGLMKPIRFANDVARAGDEEDVDVISIVISLRKKDRWLDTCYDRVKPME